MNSVLGTRTGVLCGRGGEGREMEASALGGGWSGLSLKAWVLILPEVTPVKPGLLSLHH